MKKRKTKVMTFTSRLPELQTEVKEFAENNNTSISAAATLFAKVGVGLFHYNRTLFDDLSYKFKEIIKS